MVSLHWDHIQIHIISAASSAIAHGAIAIARRPIWHRQHRMKGVVPKSESYRLCAVSKNNTGSIRRIVATKITPISNCSFQMCSYQSERSPPDVPYASLLQCVTVDSQITAACNTTHQTR